MKQLKKLSKKEISDLIQKTKKQLSDFERNIKKAPKEAHQEFKFWTRKNKSKLKRLEKQFKATK
jgi:predicted DNA-binding protein YlxM (UPF0122 family)